MEKLFNRIFWKNRPERITALGAILLNKIDMALDALDNRVIEMNATKLSIEAANSMVKSFGYDKLTGIITVTLLDGTVYKWDLNIEKIPVNLSLTSDAVLILETTDGEVYEADLKGLIDTYIFDDSDTLAFSVTQGTDGKHVTAEVKKGSLTGEHLNPDYLAEIQKSVTEAQGQAEVAADSAALAKRWTIGDEANYPESVTDNAKYYAELAQAAAEQAKQTVNINLPDVYVDTETMNLMGRTDTEYKIYMDENGMLWGGIGNG